VAQMTPEEVDLNIKFILKMQAQFEANLGRLELNMDRPRDSQATLTASVVRIAEILEESVKHTDERFARLDQRFLVNSRKPRRPLTTD
jgi:hypothetical protein